MSEPHLEYWQIAAGSVGRDYSQAFLDYGIAFVGGKKSEDKMEAEVKKGHLFVLKQGTSRVLAIGIVQSDGRRCTEDEKPWLYDFDGWQLPAFCSVKWIKIPESLRNSVPGLTRGTLLKIAIANEKTRHAVDDLMEKAFPEDEVKDEPVPVARMKDEELIEYLVHMGLRPSDVDNLTRAVKHVRLLAHYYYWEKSLNWEDVREHETRSFLVLPLLLALGWPQQHIKIELPTGKGGKVDIACFSKSYRRCGENRDANVDDCRLIVETKGFASGLDYAKAQAEAYASEYTNCSTIIVTNGYCYKAYERESATEFSSTPCAYLNILRPTDKYPLDPSVKGAKEALGLLLPSIGR